MSRRLWLFNVSCLPPRFSGYCYCSSSDALCNPPAATAVGFSLRTTAHRQTISQTRLDRRRRAASTACTQTRLIRTANTQLIARARICTQPSRPETPLPLPNVCSHLHTHTHAHSHAHSHIHATTALLSPPEVASREKSHAPLKRPQSGTQIADATMTPQKTAYTVTRKLSST